MFKSPSGRTGVTQPLAIQARPRSGEFGGEQRNVDELAVQNDDHWAEEALVFGMKVESNWQVRPATKFGS